MAPRTTPAELLIRRKTHHGFKPDGITHRGRPICGWCGLSESADVHDMTTLEPSKEESRQMENGLGSIPTIEITRAYLATERSALWGQFWSIKDEDRLEEAARWLAREVDRINAIRNMAMASDKTVEVVVERARNMERHSVEGIEYE